MPNTNERRTSELSYDETAAQNTLDRKVDAPLPVAARTAEEPVLERFPSSNLTVLEQPSIVETEDYGHAIASMEIEPEIEQKESLGLSV